MIRVYNFEMSQWELRNFDDNINRVGQSLVLYDTNGCKIPDIDIPPYLRDNLQFTYSDIVFVLPIFQQFTILGYFTDIETIERQFQLDGLENPYVKNSFLTKNSYLDGAIFEITGETDSKLDSFFNFTAGYDIGLNYSQTPEITFDGVLSQNEGIIDYVVGALLDNNGNIIPQTGVYYTTNFQLKSVQDANGNYEIQHKTTFKTWSIGRADDDYSLLSYYHDDKKSNMVQIPIVDSNLDFDRTTLSVFEPHFRLEELRTSTQIEKYQNNYFIFK